MRRWTHRASGSAALLLFIAGTRTRRNLARRAAARDFRRIAGRESFLELPGQLVVNFSSFPLFPGLFLLGHFATSVLRTWPRCNELVSEHVTAAGPDAQQ